HAGQLSFVSRWLLEEMPLFGYLRQGLVLLLVPRRSSPRQVVVQYDEMVLLFHQE
ncbi:hypothetical protein A2U01_0097461, partial [Trifolium medium]|nr:hypothetical protein [Trifolium medium]